MATNTMEQEAIAAWWSPKTIMQILFVNFGLFFQSTCCVLGQLFSLFIYPFSFKLYRQYIAFMMRTWSENLVLLIQWFAPTKCIMTFDESCGSMQDIVQKDVKTGDVNGLVFPERIIVTSNHQVNINRRHFSCARMLTCRLCFRHQIYADWVYIWCLAYLAKAHGALKIILKSSLKNLPVYGQ